jgi:DNA-binding NarL/FixJ family response regulator
MSQSTERSSATPEVRLVLVDDQTIFREMLSEVVMARARGRYAIAAEFQTGASAIAKIPALAPHVVVLDLILPDMNGLDVLRSLKRARRSPKVLIVTACEQPPAIRDALDAGAHGIVTKGAPLHELITAIDCVASNGTFFCSSSSELLRKGAASREDRKVLTGRERLILQRVAKGATSKEIASQLGLSEKTVHNHRHNIKKKLGISDLAGLIRFAATRGLIGAEE